MQPFGLFPPTLAEIAQIAETVMGSLPPVLLRYARDVVIQVEDVPDSEVMETQELESPFDLLGLYHGVDLPRRGLLDIGHTPDRIHLYRRALLDYWCASDEPLEAIIRHVFIHEIGGHFGFSDEAIEALETDKINNKQ